MTAPLRVLFVCTANICRSPFMELLTAHLAGGGIEASSAGTHGFAGHPMDGAMAASLLRHGIPAQQVDDFRSRPLTADLVAAADLVLTAESSHRRHIVEEEPAAAPKVFTLGQFATAAGEAEGETGADLVRAIWERRPAAEPALDVADPYRRGAGVAAACADQVESLLRVAVPALTRSGRISA